MSLVRLATVLMALSMAACATVRETTLSNGLKVVVKEDHRAPVVVSQIWYKIGAVDEPEGLTGISHVLEHMMFKGTRKHPSGEFSRIIAENGGRENAFTGYDYTAYFQQLEKSRLPIAFELEADRMQNLVLDEDEYQKEIRVVMEERRLRTDDQPESLAYEKFMNTAFRAHPYRNPIIGWMRDLERLSIADVRRWYERWYVPNNATLVVVGDVNPRQVFAHAQQYFGQIPARPVNPAKIPKEPVQREMRRAVVRLPAKVPSLIMGYHVPALRDGDDWEPYALLVLSGVLDGGRSARLDSRLVRGRQLAAAVGAGYNAASRYPVLFTIQGTPAKSHKVGELEAAIRHEVERLRTEPITGDELARVKAQVAASDVYQRDSVFYQAMQMGMLETDGIGWQRVEDHVNRIRAVTAEQVRRVANKYLTDSNLTVTVLEPDAGKPGRSKPPAPGAGHGH